MNQTVSERKARNVLAPWSKQAAVNTPTFVRGEGSWLIDEAGKRYLDLSAGLVAVNMGHTHPKITAAITQQAQKVAVRRLHSSTTCAANWLTSFGTVPLGRGRRTFFTTGGGEAIGRHQDGAHDQRPLQDPGCLPQLPRFRTGCRQPDR